MPNQKIKSFMDLVGWQEAHKLVLTIYIITKKFPHEESFALTSQMRRAAVSITSNLAEGFSRQSYNDKIRFYFMAQGYNTELQNQLLIARDIHYITTEQATKIVNQCIVVQKLIYGLIKKSRLLNSS